MKTLLIIVSMLLVGCGNYPTYTKYHTLNLSDFNRISFIVRTDSKYIVSDSLYKFGLPAMPNVSIKIECKDSAYISGNELFIVTADSVVKCDTVVVTNLSSDVDEGAVYEMRL